MLIQYTERMMDANATRAELLLISSRKLRIEGIKALPEELNPAEEQQQLQ